MSNLHASLWGCWIDLIWVNTPAPTPTPTSTKENQNTNGIAVAVFIFTRILILWHVHSVSILNDPTEVFFIISFSPKSNVFVARISWFALALQPDTYVMKPHNKKTHGIIVSVDYVVTFSFTILLLTQFLNACSNPGFWWVLACTE